MQGFFDVALAIWSGAVICPGFRCGAYDRRPLCGRPAKVKENLQNLVAFESGHVSVCERPRLCKIILTRCSPRCAVVCPAFRCGIRPLAKMVSANNVPIGLARYKRSDTCGFSSLRITGSTISIKAPYKQFNGRFFTSVGLYAAAVVSR
jgi:hypothetical protein